MAVSMTQAAHPGAPVVLPIRVDCGTDAEDAECIERDQSVADYVCAVGMPMAAVQPAGSDKFRMTYSLEGDEGTVLRSDDRKGWTAALKEITCHALGVAKMGLESAAEAVPAGTETRIQ
jgi:hypothetical protein